MYKCLYTYALCYCCGRGCVRIEIPFLLVLAVLWKCDRKRSITRLLFNSFPGPKAAKRSTPCHLPLALATPRTSSGDLNFTLHSRVHLPLQFCCSPQHLQIFGGQAASSWACHYHDKQQYIYTHTRTPDTSQVSSALPCFYQALNLLLLQLHLLAICRSRWNEPIWKIIRLVASIC